MANLRDTQKIFWRLITAPEGVRQGLEELSDRDRWVPGGLDGLICGDDRLSAVDRLDIYANMYFYRILDILKEDFPAVLAVIGDTRFHNLVTAYLIEHPSTHYSVRDLGRHLSAFLSRHDLAREWPWLPDLARLEWGILEAFDGPDADPLPPDRLQSIAPPQWATVRFRLTPTLEVLRASARVDWVWAAATAGNPLPEIPEDPVTLRVWRTDLRVLHRAVERAEASALDAVLAGEDFGGVCEALAAVESEDRAPEIAARVLHVWFADGLVTGID